MTANRPPRPAVDLFPEYLQLSAKQREVLSQLQTYPRGARSVDLAGDLGMHVNTVRGHLDELISRGAVHATTSPAQGRGRPSLIFRVSVPDNRAIAHQYISLVRTLTALVLDAGRLTPAALGRAHEIGRAWARQTITESGAHEPASTAGEAAELLFAGLRELGFDPIVRRTGVASTVDLELHACPFVSDGQGPSPAVCAMHEGFLQESMSSSSVQVSLRPFHPAGACTVTATHCAQADPSAGP